MEYTFIAILFSSFQRWQQYSSLFPLFRFSFTDDTAQAVRSPHHGGVPSLQILIMVLAGTIQVGATTGIKRFWNNPDFSSRLLKYLNTEHGRKKSENLQQVRPEQLPLGNR